MLRGSWPFETALTVTAVIDILAVAILIYNFALMLRGRRAIHVLTGLSVLVVVYVVASQLGLELLRSVLAALAPYTAIALIVMFHSELRAALARLGRIRWLGLGGRLERGEVAEEILLSVEQMMASRTGALIVLEGDLGLRTFIESGVSLDAKVSRDLLCSIFHFGGELHDGAVIIQGDRIAAAACFLPLHTSPMGRGKLGTRHRAGIGVTEESDSLAVVISEETGQVSIAWRGELEANVTPDRLREAMAAHASGGRVIADVLPEQEQQLGQVEL